MSERERVLEKVMEWRRSERSERKRRLRVMQRKEERNKWKERNREKRRKEHAVQKERRLAVRSNQASTAVTQFEQNHIF